MLPNMVGVCYKKQQQQQQEPAPATTSTEALSGFVEDNMELSSKNLYRRGGSSYLEMGWYVQVNCVHV